MKKKIMIIVFGISLVQSLQAESFDVIFEEQHHVLSDLTVAKQPEKKNLTVWAALKLAPQYVYETHFKPRFYAMVSVLFKRKKAINVKG